MAVLNLFILYIKNKLTAKIREKSNIFLPTIKCFVIAFYFIINLSSTAQKIPIDSLENLLSITPEDTSKIRLYDEIIIYYIQKRNNFDNVKEYATKQLALALKLDHKLGIANAYINYGIYYRWKSNYQLSLEYLDKALTISQKLKDNNRIGTIYFNIGSVYLVKGNYNIALEYLLKTEKIQEDLKDEKSLKGTYTNIAIVYNSMGKAQRAITYHFKGLKINEALNDSIAIAANYNNIGVILSQQNDKDAAINYFIKALRIKEKMGDKRGVATASNNIGEVYLEKKKYDQALSYFLESLKCSEQVFNKEGIANSFIKIGRLYEEQNSIALALKYLLKAQETMKQIDSKTGMQDSYNSLGVIYEKQKKYNKAIDSYRKSLNLAKETNYNEGMRDAYKNLASVYTKVDSFKKAFEYINLFYVEKDSLLNKENFRQLTEINTRYETDKKETEIQLLTKDQIINKKNRKQQKIIWLGLIIGIILLFIVLSLLYKRYRFKQKTILLLEKQKQEIEKQKTLITDSIDFAKSIQEALLPSESRIKKLLPESFVFFKPKDIVSGDFYWIKEKYNKIICIVADCAGHGVAGAFLSLLGINMLDNIINRAIPEPASILNLLNEEIINTISQQNADINALTHGMDITILIIDKNKMQAQYAGAHNSLYQIRNNTLIETKADKIALGTNTQNLHFFTNHVIDINKDDVFYLFTDGFPDQIGGGNKKKFYYAPFKELLTKIHLLNMNEQKTILEDTITEWMGERKQMDDILIMGIKI